ncbi:TetR/AcrR family transcriptional regulator [Rhodococcus sp. NPDC056960]|uniref:TetR/AcrR family transcriptional regulator n=1 Tax=Rhodococcus sp. NPDC056960 TaxID=3345982 RepID=UPI00362F9BF2
MAESQASARPRRRRGTREDTEDELLDAALRLIKRDGVLVGITLREVAKEAGVNHGQIYQYFGTRQILLRAAISRMLGKVAPHPSGHWDLPFSDRRRSLWKISLQNRDLAKLQALLALDEDEQFDIFPAIESTRAALERDKKTGALPRSADGEVMHALTAATYLGYGIFREAIGRALDIPLAELDTRSAAVFDLMLAGLQHGDSECECPCSSTTSGA